VTPSSKLSYLLVVNTSSMVRNWVLAMVKVLVLPFVQRMTILWLAYFYERLKQKIWCNLGDSKLFTSFIFSPFLIIFK
jgi:hypothetical protein